MEYRKGLGVFLKACLGCLLGLTIAFCASAPSFAGESLTPKPKPEPKKPGAHVPTAARATGGNHPAIAKNRVVPRQKRGNTIWWFVSAGGGWFAYYDTFTKDRRIEGEHEQWSGYFATGLRHFSFEAELRIGLGHVLHVGKAGHYQDRETVRLSLLGLEAGLGLYGYTVRSRLFRMRHGGTLGVHIPLATKCRFFDEIECDQLRSELRLEETFMVTVHVWDLGFRLARGWWLEVSLLNIGYPVVISVSTGLRWESSGLDG